jgi:hypothetical protein
MPRIVFYSLTATFLCLAFVWWGWIARAVFVFLFR